MPTSATIVLPGQPGHLSNLNLEACPWHACTRASSMWRAAVIWRERPVAEREGGAQCGLIGASEWAGICSRRHALARDPDWPCTNTTATVRGRLFLLQVTGGAGFGQMAEGHGRSCLVARRQPFIAPRRGRSFRMMPANAPVL